MMIFCYLVDWYMVAWGKRCETVEDEMKMGKVSELTECAELCRNASAKMFMYGTNDNPPGPIPTRGPIPENGCDDKEDACECVCETTSFDCTKIKDSNYNLYKYLDIDDLEIKKDRMKIHLPCKFIIIKL